jgi:hypothetical protein
MIAPNLGSNKEDDESNAQARPDQNPYPENQADHRSAS